MRALTAALLLLAAGAGPAAAQETFTLDLSRGTQVRVTTVEAPAERVVGRVTTSTRDTLALLTRGSARAFAVPELATLEVRGGLDRRRGALIGAGLGVLVALIGGGIDVATGDAEVGEVLGVAAGNGLIFGVIGYAFAPKGWEPLPIPTAR